MNNISKNIAYPESINKIITGRSSTENWLKNNYKDFYEYITEKYIEGITINEKIYMFYNNILTRPTCKTCGAPVNFINYSRGFAQHCCKKCTQLDSYVRKKYHDSCRKKYGDDYIKHNIENGKKTKLEKYGDENYNNSNKAKQTCLEKYGVDNPMKSEIIKEKSRNTCLEKYGVEYYLASTERIKHKNEHNKKAKQTCLEKYGVDNPMKSECVRNKVNKSCLEKYGCKWNCMRKEAHNSHNVNSGPNKYIQQLLKAYNIEFTTEFPIENYVFDFKIENTLIEMNPYPTHNINWSPYGAPKIDKYYHQLKTDTAKKYGYKIINIWDWDNTDMIIQSLTPKINIYARNCTLKKVSKKDAKTFLLNYHFQGYCNNQSIIYGLYYNNELVQLMSFGKPRYNKNYEYELLRLCTKFGYIVVGGTQKLFKTFINNNNPSSIISYCDDSKFTGSIYNKLGFICKQKASPSRHWFEPKNNIHLTDNLLRQKGFDILFGTNYGKGVSNYDLMISHKFVEIYDAGQSTWTWKNKITP